MNCKKVFFIVTSVIVVAMSFVYISKGGKFKKARVLGDEKELASQSGDSCEDIVNVEGEKELVENKTTHNEYIKRFSETVKKKSEEEIAKEKEKKKKEEEKKKKEKKEKQKKKEEEKKKEATKLKSGLSSDDMNLFYHIVEAEAGGEDIKGRILVANVILNRVKSSKFPNTLKGVVYQGKQFSPTFDGRLWKVSVSSGTKSAVQRALDGEDYSQGAFYFMERSLAASSASSWFDRSLTRLFRHGCHEFFK